jgi:hypothetical protein
MNGMNGMNVMNGMNGMNGMHGMHVMHTRTGLQAVATLSTQGLILAAWNWVYFYHCKTVYFFHPKKVTEVECL